jgi:NAD(P)-dependent dehydrogenase (short-subunit alcohol dehydrogenase family)
MVYLVTGARSGIGLLTAITLARAGHTVYAGLRDPTTDKDLRAAGPGLDLRPIALDVSSPADCTAAVARILTESGRIDGLVNNAGVALGGFLEQIDDDEMRRLFDVNVFGLWDLTCKVLPTMRAQKSGCVVHVTSMAGRLSMPGLGAYAASKWAVEGMAEAWRHELRPFGVRMCLIEPGPYKTDIFGRNRTMARRMTEPDGPYAVRSRALDAIANKATDRIAGDPQEVADRILELLTDYNPPLRVPIGPTAHLRLALRLLLPWSVLEAVVARLTAGGQES